MFAYFLQAPTNETNGLVSFKNDGEANKPLSRVKRQGTGGLFMRIISAIALGAGLASGGGLAMAAGGALGGSVGLMAASRADEDYKNSVIEECGEQETFEENQYICTGFSCTADCPSCICSTGKTTGATASGVGGSLGGSSTPDCCLSSTYKNCCYCCCLS